MPNNCDRLLVEFIAELCAERGIHLERCSHDWILRLTHAGQAAHIYGYDFPLNSATSRLLAGDKAAASDLFAHAGLPHVPHRLFLHPRLGHYIGSTGNWTAMCRAFTEFGGDAVLKPNDGTGGSGVTRITSPAELEEAAQRLFVEHRALALSPFLTYEHEYRCLLLDGECLLLYRKARPAVTGDGRSSIAQLAAAAGLPLPEAENAPPSFDASFIPGAGERTLLAWKHNLGSGALPEAVADAGLAAHLQTLACRALEALGLRLASIDLIEVEGVLRLLEANSGIMLESFARTAPGGRERAKGVYGVVLGKMFR